MFFRALRQTECKIECLEISVDTVAFMANEDVGSHHSVIKVGEPDGTEMTIWIVDVDKARSWIAVFKQVVLRLDERMSEIFVLIHNFNILNLELSPPLLSAIMLSATTFLRLTCLHASLFPTMFVAGGREVR
ncbi:hypothetical protein B0H21DRAFT_894710 [Amylocystis lapponica]|nr:hypothetical protein B0H21DRAFT_894710 [Amylocystis lapponica]